MSEATRQFLRPRVGIEPASVPIERGPQAEELAAAYHADALAIGDAVALGAGHSADTPETLGLLAHELVHVARRRSPHFVPPVVRPIRGRARGTSAITETAADEETLALRVEAAVVHEARQQQSALAQGARSAALSSGVGATDQSGPPLPPTGIADQGGQEAPAAQSDRPPALAGGWGGLPAPWEPLHLPAAQSPAPGQPTYTSSSAAHVPGAAPTPVSRAAHGRSLPAVRSAQSALAETPAQGEPDEAPSPDLDLLARQIYPILRRRLQAEQRRGG